MNENEIANAIVAASFAWLLGFLMGGYVMYTDWRNWVIRKKLGEWQVNSVTGEKSFVWFDERNAKQPT